MRIITRKQEEKFKKEFETNCRNFTLIFEVT